MSCNGHADVAKRAGRNGRVLLVEHHLLRDRLLAARLDPVGDLGTCDNGRLLDFCRRLLRAPAPRCRRGSQAPAADPEPPSPSRFARSPSRRSVCRWDRKLAVTWSLRRNTDKGLPATHTVEIMFKLPADFSFGSVSNVPGMLMKQTEFTRGVPLAGTRGQGHARLLSDRPVKYGSGQVRNIQLLNERAWFDIPVVYSNNRRAILAMQKRLARRARLRRCVRGMEAVTPCKGPHVPSGPRPAVIPILSATNEKMHGIWGRGLN